MKFIATRDFSQGLNNPLKMPTGESHIKKGMFFILAAIHLATGMEKDYAPMT